MARRCLRSGSAVLRVRTSVTAPGLLPRPRASGLRRRDGADHRPDHPARDDQHLDHPVLAGEAPPSAFAGRGTPMTARRESPRFVAWTFSCGDQRQPDRSQQHQSERDIGRATGPPMAQEPRNPRTEGEQAVFTMTMTRASATSFTPVSAPRWPGTRGLGQPSRAPSHLRIIPTQSSGVVPSA